MGKNIEMRLRYKREYDYLYAFTATDQMPEEWQQDITTLTTEDRGSESPQLLTELIL